MKDFSIEEKTKLAIELFETGHNCAQSVFMAYADVFNLEPELAAALSVGFGGGMGRMREICGAVSAMAMIAGLKYPVADNNNREQRTRTYAAVQEMANRFKKCNNTIICRELLKSVAGKDTSPTPEMRSAQYYSKRPCTRLVADAAYITGKIIKEETDW
ncbi:MAG: C-GCAxxG-C-C family protein [Tannerellaceae bacterium]|nr:C-GCAxxG-C-C family protein [Tannerellaceae bacterium]MCD8262877.1 C-GCAxxG-C-C family protein [Tannerellaceae bacterium]